MNGVHDLEKKVASLELYDETPPVTGVALIVDAENEFLAGDDSGYMIEIECPYGTQEMADAMLASIEGRTYKGYHATAAELDPLAELGDIVMVDGTTSVLLDRVINFGPGHMSEISAPGENELEHEYGYASPTQRQTDRKIAITRSMISKTAEEITLKVESVEGEIEQLSSSLTVELEAITARVSDAEGNYTELKTTVDGVTVTDTSTGVTRIRGDSIDTSTLNVDNINIDLEGAISWTDLDTDMQTRITKAEDAAADAVAAVDSITYTYNNTTYIDGSKIMTGTVIASSLMGGSVSLLDSSEDEVGLITLSDASSATYAVDIESYAAMRLEAAGDLYLVSDQCWFMLSSGSLVASCSDFRPSGDAPYLGTSTAAWEALYTWSGTFTASDRNRKHDIEALDDRYIAMLDLIEPKRFKMNDGTSDRYHTGFIAQEVEEAMNAVGLTDLEFAGWCKNQDADGNDIYFLRYDEFISPLLAKVRELDARVKALEA